MERSYTADGSLEVLVSPGHGGGWSTSNCWGIDIAIDKRIIEFWKSYPQINMKTLKRFMAACGYPDAVCDGWKTLRLKTVPKGRVFRITEYDGFETIKYFNTENWVTA